VKLKNQYVPLVVFAVAQWLVAAAWAAPREKVLHAFYNRPAHLPTSRLVADAAGALYGTTELDGIHQSGTVYQLSPVSGGGWIYRVLHVFNGRDGAKPYGGTLLLDAAGSLYGVTLGGGANGSGIVFELSPGSGGKWIFKTLHNFNFTDGAEPTTSLVMDASGILYGGTDAGGTTGVGVIYSLTPESSGHWRETVLHNFTPDDGTGATAGLTFDSTANNLYGATTNAVFVLTRNSGGGWTESTAYKFQMQDGNAPNGDLIFDSAGNLYGTCEAGGTQEVGTAFRLTPQSGGGWTSTVLHSFPADKTDGFSPSGGLALDSAGNVYGTTQFGGLSDAGTVYKLTNNTWSETVLHNFTGGHDGAVPLAGLILDKSGNLYGTTANSGAGGAGVLFEIIR
jgi:uncharacterized repeat protein (TIGR03803 family)